MTFWAANAAEPRESPAKAAIAKRLAKRFFIKTSRGKYSRKLEVGSRKKKEFYIKKEMPE
jgi:hypothetical protein